MREIANGCLSFLKEQKQPVPSNAGKQKVFEKPKVHEGRCGMDVGMSKPNPGHPSLPTQWF